MRYCHRRLARRLVFGALIASFGLWGPAIAAGRTALAAPATKTDRAKEIKPPRLAVRATPTISFSPSRISVYADLEGGPDDYEAYYCPTVEWNWGDGTTSEASNDCDPYQAGKSQIQRHYSVEHTYREPGHYRIFFMLKKDGKVIAKASSLVLVRPGLGTGPGGWR